VGGGGDVIQRVVVNLLSVIFVTLTIYQGG
jgi:hypothetical protein